MIAKTQIVRLRMENHPQAYKWAQLFSVPSSRGPNYTYVVAQDKKGEWACSCPRWVYHREECKHIKAVLTAITQEAPLGEITETAEMLSARAKFLEL